MGCCEVVGALEKATGVAVMPAPIDLDDTDSVEQMAVTKADAPHADQGLQLDRRPFLLREGL